MKVERLVTWIVGLAPALVVASTWSPELTSIQLNIRALALPVVAAEIFVIAFVFTEKISLDFPPISLAIPLGILVILAWFTALNAESQGSSILLTSIWTIHLFFGFAVASLWAEAKVSAAQIILSLQVGFSISALLIVLYVVTFYRSDINWVWALPGFHNIRHLGYYAVAIIGISALGFSDGRRFAFFTATFAFFIVFWTVSRGAIVASAVGYLFTAFHFEVFRRREVVLRFVACALTGFLLSVFFTENYPLDAVGLERIVNGDYNGRTQLWIHTLASIKDSPWIGWGEAQLRSRLGNDFPFGQPHNIILQILHAWGLIGLSLIIYISIMIIIRIKNISTDEIMPFSFAATIIILFSFIDGALYYVNSVSIFVICISIMCSSRRESAPSTVRN